MNNHGFYLGHFFSYVTRSFFPDAAALNMSYRSYKSYMTYSELNRKLNQVANGLKAIGIGKGGSVDTYSDQGL